MKLAFILTAYDRIDDLLAHLDILKFFPEPCEIIPIWMRKDVPQYFLDELAKYPHAHYCDGIRFNIGPLLGLVSGIRKAHEIGVEYVVYRNGDDWLLNHAFVLENLRILDSGKDVAAYNWLSYDCMTEFALNEMYLRVNKFIRTVDDAELYFRSSKSKFLCELKISRWIKRTLGMNLESQFYRLPDRELNPGIGFEPDTFKAVFQYLNMEMPPGFIDSLEDNHRFFNRKWQLIGSHDNPQRYSHYCDIRGSIPYREQLEKQPHFVRWLESIHVGTPWNLLSPKRTDPELERYMKQKPVLRFHSIPAVKVPKLLPKRRTTGVAKTIHPDDAAGD